ncbi:hypothetical protein DdX_06657 [Ditylenchus destructor]|uniref:Uncharacterized protein n=1 Tax=Ditylenchus destructor TaxID=166010 RepID=A0AAD4R8Z6_9BILA|nr:hypothetical protein DdX_06657 [Ditylenchus destructor]
MEHYSYFSSYRHRSFSQSQPVCSPRKTELSEIDFAYELLRMLLPDKALSDYFTEDSQRRIRLAKGYNVNANALNIGRKFIPDILEGCSECREKLMTIQKFLSVKTSDEQLAVNKFVFDLRTQLGKIHNFYNGIFNASSLTIDAQLEILQKMWDKFLFYLGEFTCNLDDLIPLWELLFDELLNILGKYLDNVFHAKTTSESTNSEVERNNGIQLETYLSRLWTPNAKMNMESCVLYHIKLNEWKHQYRAVELNQITFKTLVNKELKYHPERDHNLGMLTDLMERVTSSKKQQYEDYIFNTIQSGEELKNTLNEIKGFYTLRILAPFIADFEHRKFLPPQAEEYLLRTTGVVLTHHNDLNDTASSLELTSPKKWSLSITQNDNMPTVFNLKHELELPLTYVFDDEFWQLLSECFKVCQELLCAQTQMSEVIVFGALRDTMMQDRDVRKNRCIANNLLNSVIKRCSNLHSCLDEKIDKYCDQLVHSTSLAQIEQVVRQWKMEFRRVLDKESPAYGTCNNATVATLCGKVREFGSQYGRV